MTELATVQRHGVLTEPATLTIHRLLPGPIERVWSYLTESDLRRRWLAAGLMDVTVGASVELVWRNDDLTESSGQRPEGSLDEHRMQVQVTEADPPRRLSITWGAHGAVTFELQPQGDEVLLTLTHRRVPDRAVLLNVAAGWHMHLDILDALVRGGRPEPFWDGVARLKGEYDRRLPA